MVGAFFLASKMIVGIESKYNPTGILLSDAVQICTSALKLL